MRPRTSPARRVLVGALVLATAAALFATCTGSGGARRATSKTTAAPGTVAPTTTTPVTGVAAGGDVYAHTHAGDLSPAVAGVPPRVYVPNSDSNTVDVIDPATFRIIDHFAVKTRPQHVVPSWDLTTLYVNDNVGNALTPIDPRTGKPGTDIPVADPYNLYFTPDGSKAIVMAERESSIDFRDPHTWTLLKRVPVPHTGVNHAEFTADGRTMIASCEFSGWLVRVDLATMAITGQLRVGGMPIDVRLSPDGSVMYVANQGRGGVSVIDPVSLTEIGFIPTGAGAHGLYPSRDGTQLYVTNRLAGSISVIDFATRRVLTTWHIGGTPDMGGVSADGSQLWITGRYSQAVYVVDTRTGRLLATIKVGRGPHGLCLFPQPGRYSLGHTGNYR